MDTPDGVYDLTVSYDRGEHALVVHPVAIETSHGLILVDVGLPGATAKLENALAEHDLSLDDVATVFLTHHDADHAAGLAALEAETDAFVIAHRDEAPYVDGRRNPLKADADAARYPPVTVDLELAGEETFHTEAGPAWVVETPGHTPGHVSLYLPDERLLVAGDALTADADDGRLHGPKPQYTLDRDMARESVAALAALDVERTLCYHGGLVDAGTARIVELAEAGP